MGSPRAVAGSRSPQPDTAIVATSQHGNPYPNTEADSSEPNNLLSLPERR
jgi:hypothetical protein